MAVDRAYFVVGSKVYPYDLPQRTTTGEQWELSDAWAGLDGEFATTIDAALDLGTFVLYVFRGTQYDRISFATQAVDVGYPQDLSNGNWPDLTFSTLDAAMNWSDGKVYLFSGRNYVRYDIAADRQDPGYPKPIAGNWKNVSAAWVGDGIDAALNPGTGRVYFFKGSEYITLDWATKSQIAGPAPIAADWPGLTGPFDAAWTNASDPPPAGPSAGAAAFVAAYGAFADASEAETGVPALVTLGQAALESNWGAAAPGNNFFGIKARASDPPDSRQLLKTTEVLASPNAEGSFPEFLSKSQRPDGKWTYVVRDWFRVYPSPAEAFIGHGRFLRDNSRYAHAFEHLDDPYEFARQVAKAGYATAPNYADVLVARMQQIAASE